MKTLTQIGASAGSSDMKNLPKYYSDAMGNNFSKDTIRCLYKSRDF